MQDIDKKLAKLRKFKAFVNIANGLMAPLSLYLAFKGNNLQFLVAGLNAYLFIDGLGNIKEQFFSKQEKV